MKKIILILLIILLITACKKEVVEETHYTTFRLKPDFNAEYSLELNNSMIKSGTLETSWNDIIVENRIGEYKIYYWNNEYYVDYHTEYISDVRNQTVTKELKFNPSNKIGNITAQLSSVIKKGENNIELIFTVNGTIKKFTYCIYRSIGILSAEPESYSSICKTQPWSNVTEYGNLSNNEYFCDNLIAQCETIAGSKCERPVIKVNFDIEADVCYFLAKTLSNEEYRVPLKVETMDYFDNSDYLLITLMDMDLSQDRRIFGKHWGYDFKSKGEVELI